jgi:hypothetical protein
MGKRGEREFGVDINKNRGSRGGWGKDIIRVK